MKPRIVHKYGGTSIGTADRMLGVVEIIKSSRAEADIVVAISAMSSQVKAEGTTSLLLRAADEALANGNTHEPLERIKAHHYAALQAALGGSLAATGAADDAPARAGGLEAQRYFDKRLAEVESFLHAIGIIKELSPRSYDAIVSVGEQLSACLLTCVLEAAGVPSAFVDLSNVCPADARTPDNAFWDSAQKQIGLLVEPIVEDGRVPVLTGFLGPIPGGIIDAVGRGYTDFTAALAAAAVDARELQIWKEVDGVFTADPRKVPAARVLESLTPREAAELTYFGSEVVHPMTMNRAIRAGIPLRIKNTFKPHLPGTAITEESNGGASPVKCVTAKRDVIVLNIESNRMTMAYGFMASVFNVFARHGVVIDLISTSEVNLSCTIDKTGRLAEVVGELSALGDVTIGRDMAIVSVVGQRMKRTVGLANRMFGALAREGINIEMISQGASEINISCVIAGNEVERAIKVLHAELIE